MEKQKLRLRERKRGGGADWHQGVLDGRGPNDFGIRLDYGWGDVGGGRGSAIETWILERKLGNQNGHDRMKLVDSTVVLRSTGTLLDDRITFLVALFGV